ncbi:MAG: hypothetical protein EOS36_27605 [Mesorhizobium sp.]|uniref:hypothetical protein n=1 Tax=Mesorhizobium sp. TaxID=1871066 RepID=UPI000FEA9354|nr:hypothetical protein [Mesorhizobium sp.]RWD56427.1 MAG: hypothetical protein EOS36_27605 [Mesorhizobium sp.]RWE31249.1 MAG: hypothetical protein EOS79_32195 [Mesorhizobium sp.]
MKRGRHKIDHGHAAQIARLAQGASDAFAANQDSKRCQTKFVGAAGECLACGADQGVYCRAEMFGGDNDR